MEDFMEEIATASSKNKKDFETAVKEGRVVSPKAFYETVESIYILIDDLDDFIAEHQENIKELTTLFKNAVETGIGVIATVHSSKPKGFDELNKWFKTSSNGLVIGSQGTSNVYPMISAKDMPMTGEGLLYVNSVYERLLLPLYE